MGRPRSPDITTRLYGLTDRQWKEAREMYAQSFGQEAAFSAHPSAIREHWLETELPKRVEAVERKIEKKQRRRNAVQLSNKDVARAPEKLIAHVMAGVDYS